MSICKAKEVRCVIAWQIVVAQLLCGIYLCSCASPVLRLAPPAAPILPTKTRPFGTSDQYSLLEDRENPTVLKYLEDENVFADSMLKKHGSLRQEILKELRQDIQTEIKSSSIELGDYAYFTESSPGQSFPLYKRRRISNPSAVEIILDLNTLTLSAPLLKILSLRISDDHSKIAYLLSFHPGRTTSLFVRNLSSGKSDRIAEGVAAMEWLEQGKSLAYLTYDQSNRAHRLLCTELDNSAPAAILFNEPDSQNHLRLSRAKGGDFLFVNSESLESSSVGIIRSENGCNSPKFPFSRQRGKKDEISRFGEGFLVHRSDIDGQDRFFLAPLTLSSEQQLSLSYSVLGHEVLHGVEVFRDYAALLLRHGVEEHLLVLPYSKGPPFGYSLGATPLSVTFSANPNFESPLLKLSLSSYLVPETVYSYNLADRSMVTAETRPLPSVHGFVPESFEESYVYARAGDGVSIPISLVAPRSRGRTDLSPLVLYGYGAYGEHTAARFSRERLSLIARGFSFAICHVRGGGFYGRSWHNAGRLLNKAISISDYIACAEELIARGITSTGRIIAQGRSAGGILIGGALNLRPELFAAAVLDVPFLDPIGVLQDKKLPLSARDIAEWGDPSNLDHFKYLKSYSPYSNVHSQPYPSILVNSSFHDQTVQYWEAAKWVARLREHQTGGAPLLLRTDFESGHSGAVIKVTSINETATVFAFMLAAIARESKPY